MVRNDNDLVGLAYNALSAVRHAVKAAEAAWPLDSAEAGQRWQVDVVGRLDCAANDLVAAYTVIADEPVHSIAHLRERGSP